MQIGFIGLGNMGRNLVLNLQESNHEVVSWNRSEEKRDLAREAGINVVDEVPKLIDALNEERKVIWLMISAGDAIDQILFEEGNLAEQLGEGDIIIDGANSHFSDTVRRAKELKRNGIEYLDCGVSGGVEGARTGPSLMIGGDKEVFTEIEQLFADVAAENGYGYFGNSGAGHYVKMIHNGIEYGMMQAIAEGLNLLESSAYADEFELRKVVDVWNHGSIVGGNLLRFMGKALEADSDLSETEPEVGSLGTGKWTVEEAMKLGVPLTAIAHAVYSRYQSREHDEFLFKAVQAMRTEFGDHNSDERPSE